MASRFAHELRKNSHGTVKYSIALKTRPALSHAFTESRWVPAETVRFVESAAAETLYTFTLSRYTAIEVTRANVSVAVATTATGEATVALLAGEEMVT